MWSGMLPELLNTIALRCIVFYEDYLSFAGVCKSWHSAAAAAVHYSNGPPSRFPSLLLPEKVKDDREFRELFLLSNKSIRKMRLPEVYGKVWRSSCGWLVTVGDDHATQLINPLSRETINLPKVDTFPGFVETSRWYEGIQKLLIVTNNPSSLALPLVVVIWGNCSKVGFWCPEDKRWIVVGKFLDMYICDITYYNGQVYCFDKYNCIRACDVYGENPTELVDVSILPIDLYNKLQSLDRRYIIGLDESQKKKLLVVIRRFRQLMLKDEKLWLHTYKTTNFLLFAYDLEDGRWSTVNDLGKKTLFVGHSSSFWIEDATGVIKRNCIYYTDDADFLMGGGDMGIYHLSDGTIEPHFTGESCHCLTPRMWLESI